MTDKPASTLLHLGPGLGNAVANIHNAKKAASPMVNVVGGFLVTDRMLRMFGAKKDAKKGPGA